MAACRLVGGDGATAGLPGRRLSCCRAVAGQLAKQPHASITQALRLRVDDAWKTNGYRKKKLRFPRPRADADTNLHHALPGLDGVGGAQRVLEAVGRAPTERALVYRLLGSPEAR